MRYARAVQVFLIRHAEAAPDASDPHLTPAGRAQAAAIGDRLRWHDCTPTHVWTSPRARARQTAELVARGVEATVELEVVDALGEPDGAPAVVEALDRLADDPIVLLVGHEPGLSAIGARLIGAELGALDRAEAVRIVDGELRWRFAWDGEAPAMATR